MYTAKAGGRSRIAIFSPGMHDAELARHALVDDLREGIAQGLIQPHFQPLLDLGSGRSWAVEALARWHHPRLGLLLPERFIELAEETDLINELGRGMLRSACKQAALWRATIPGAEELVVAVNVSRHELEDVRFADVVAETLQWENLPAQALMLELTESAVAADADAVVERCWALRELGVRLAVDDFGTGTSSLAELRNLPVDVLKLAKPFVDALETRPGEREFVRVIVELGRVLGLTVAAEGVETEGQLALLQRARRRRRAGQPHGRRGSSGGDRASPAPAAGERRGLTWSGVSGQRVLGPRAALGRREAAALRRDRPALDAVGRRHLELDEAVLAFCSDLVDLRGAEVGPGGGELAGHPALDAQMVGLVVAATVAAGEDRRELVERQLSVALAVRPAAVGERLLGVGVRAQPPGRQIAAQRVHRAAPARRR